MHRGASAPLVAILPDNPALYPALDLINPFPIDWMIPPEMLGSEERVVGAADDLRRQAGYFVIFQPVPADRLATFESLESEVEAFRNP